MDLEVKAPIIIGSIPLRSNFSDFGNGISENQEQETGNPILQAYPDLRKNFVVAQCLTCNWYMMCFFNLFSTAKLPRGK